MCRDIWEQTPAQRNYELWSSVCSMTNRDPKTYKPLLDAIARLEKELGYELPNKP